MNTLAERLRHAMALRGIEDQKVIAEMGGVTEGAASQWLNGGTKTLKASTLARLSKRLRVNQEWLRTGTPPIESDAIPSSEFDDFSMLPRLAVKAAGSNGRGTIVFVEEEKSGRLAFRRDFLRGEGVKESEAAIIYVTGDSMQPTLPEGAAVLVDKSMRELRDNKIYAILVNDELKIKRLRKDIGGGVVIVSDNPDKTNHPDIHVPPDKEDYLSILGRAFWMGTRL
ncbi:putative c repressor [Xanthomonas phage PBR31]|uniref:Putative c repressor n=1 Tax=Xanthomonas phage PPDBI TaxID=2723911 RepID=A0A6H0X606_9CAUD|nr:helix-turn-helix transcriptional regulator [Ralstonia pickettii]NYS09345.1 helix-turn-helix transcriptional regulator [Ralstonia pickettii]QIN95380.1 putative c repressor [Xanthomonas phage PBR31]QIW89428.1 putative c repressor [Xanthomonas phage PPDBI]